MPYITYILPSHRLQSMLIMRVIRQKVPCRVLFNFDEFLSLCLSLSLSLSLFFERIADTHTHTHSHTRLNIWMHSEFAIARTRHQRGRNSSHLVLFYFLSWIGIEKSRSCCCCCCWSRNIVCIQASLSSSHTRHVLALNQTNWKAFYWKISV